MCDEDLPRVAIGFQDLLDNEGAFEAEYQVIRGAELSRNMLAFARRSELQPVCPKVNSIVEVTEGWLRRTIPETISIETKNQPDLWDSEADPARLHSALVNVIVNARDAMPDGLQGPDLARELRILSPDLPDILFSGYASEAKVHGDGPRPDDIRLMKPASRIEFLAVVERRLSLAPSQEGQAGAGQDAARHADRISGSTCLQGAFGHAMNTDMGTRRV